MSLKSEAIKRFLTAARSLANQGMSKEAIMQFAKNEFGEITELFQKQIDNIFKRPASGIEKIKIKDPDFDNTVIKMQFDEEGIPFNPKDPLKYYGAPKKSITERMDDIKDTSKKLDDAIKEYENIYKPKQNKPDVYGIRDYDTTNMSEIKQQIIKTENKLGNLDSDSPDFKEKAKVLIDEIEELQAKLKDEKPRTDKYTGGMVDVEPNLSDIGHGSDALMARTRLMSPGAQATTSTGLNYLLAEDNDNIRVPFSKGKLADAARRKFMKAAGATGAGIAALKTGLIGLGEKAAPVVEKVTENFSTTLSEAPSYFFDLVSKIKMFGKQSKVGPSERVNEYSFTGKNGDQYTLTEDITTGDAQIVKDKMGVGSYGEKTFDTINDRTVLEYKAPKQDVDVETGKGTRDAAEYEEYRVEFDQDGTQAGADAIDESIQKEIIEEASEKITKKADGGRIGFSKGKLAEGFLKFLSELNVNSTTARFLEKVFGKEAMAEMPKRDPELFKGLLETTEMYRKRDKEGLKKYMKGFLPHMNDAEIEEFIIGNPEIGDMSGVLLRLGSGRDYKAKIDMINEANKNRKLADLEVTEEMKRKPNASGGLAKLLGE